ncbi:MAG TPA: hypothetical protein VNO33_17415 [Kofleriaceae bacterium]|nr:hypothetical protein [Kofleriaceae bacterium]
MRAAGVIALAALAAACTDLSVDVSFDVPDEYEEEVASIAIDVLAPGDEEWACEHLEFGQVDEVTLGSMLVDQAQLERDSPRDDFDSVPRTGRKLFYARGYNALGQLVTAGCAEHGLVDGEVDVEIAGRPAVYLSVQKTTLRSGELESVRIGISDARTQPLPGVTARYRVVAATGATTEREAVTDEQGSLDLELEAPPWDGPQALDLDVPWQGNPIEPVTGFRLPPPRFTIEIPPSALAQDLSSEQLYQVGRIGPDGEMGLAVLGPASDAGERLVHLFLFEGDGLRAVTSESAVRAGTIGLIAGAGRDRVLVLNQDAWHEIAADGAVTSNPDALGLAGDARRAIALPSVCGVDAPRDRLLVDDGTGLFVFAGDLQPQSSPLAIGAGLVAAGCLLGNGGVYPSVVYERQPGLLQLMADIEDARPAPWPSDIRRGASFTPQIGTDAAAGPYALANRIEVDGESIARHSLVRGPEERLALDVKLEDEVAGISLATAGGDFDDDGNLDVAALVLVPTPGQPNEAEARAFIALGATLEGERLAGQSTTLAADAPSTLRFLDSQLFTADIDGDGFDELIVASRTRADIFDLVP